MKRPMLVTVALIVAFLSGSSVSARAGAMCPSPNLNASSTADIGVTPGGQPAAAATVSSGIDLLVLNQGGEPASDAFVTVHRPGYFSPILTGYTNSAGQLHLSVADGEYNIGTASTADHFVVLQEGVRAPGAVTMTCASTVPVQVLVKGLDGLPSAGAQVSFEPNIFLGQVGETGADGRLNVSLSPRMYCGLAASSVGRFYQNWRDLNITGPSELTFDASQMQKGYLALELHGLPSVGIMPMPLPQCRIWSPTLMLSDGQSVALTVGRYALPFLLQLHDSTDAAWKCYMRTAADTIDIQDGVVATLQAGQSYTGTLTATASGCGTQFRLLARVVDAYGNWPSDIYKDERNVQAHIVLRAPNGDVLLEADRLDTTWWSGATLTVPGGAGAGLYTIDWRMDTGPLAGMLQLRAELEVACHQTYLPLAMKH
jgi:hypothetical protein